MFEVSFQSGDYKHPSNFSIVYQVFYLGSFLRVISVFSHGFTDDNFFDKKNNL